MKIKKKIQKKRTQGASRRKGGRERVSPRGGSRRGTEGQLLTKEDGIKEWWPQERPLGAWEGAPRGPGKEPQKGPKETQKGAPKGDREWAPKEPKRAQHVKRKRKTESNNEGYKESPRGPRKGPQGVQGKALKRTQGCSGRAPREAREGNPKEAQEVDPKEALGDQRGPQGVPQRASGRPGRRH
jgi:hypothetical protein